MGGLLKSESFSAGVFAGVDDGDFTISFTAVEAFMFMD